MSNKAGSSISSGKKGKKAKGTVISLQSFLSNGDAPIGTTQVAKKIRNVDGDDSDEGSNALPLVYQLPSAPRANRLFDDESVPHSPPFIAYITNLPFDIHEDDVHAFFAPMSLVSLRLPREDGDTGRLRGFGYIELESRDDLIHALSLPDPCIKGRRIRIDLSNEQDQNRQKNRRNYDGFSNNENRESTNWRRDNQNADTGSTSHDRGYDRAPREKRSEDTGAPGSWRMGNRPTSHEPMRNDYDKPRNTNIRNKTTDREKVSLNENDERPKLNLKPRTLPLPEIVQKVEEDDDQDSELGQSTKVSGVSSEKVFGCAKPVDTASRELEIEERLAESRRKEKLQEKSDEEEITEKLENVHLKKKDKDSTNSVISWRTKTETDNSDQNQTERRSYSRQDDRHRDRDFNRNKPREKNERSDYGKIKSQSNRDFHKSREGSENKMKREVKVERPLMPKQVNPVAPILQSSNKYSGLDDEASE